jgi:hypothetical protein
MSRLLPRTLGRFLATAPLLLTLAACSDPLEVEPPFVELRTDRESYQVGDTAVLSLINHHPLLTVRFGPGCTFLPEVLAEGDWVVTGGPYACPLVFRFEEIGPGRTVERPFIIDESRFPPDGEYRWTGWFWIRSSKSVDQRSSNVFIVEE